MINRVRLVYNAIMLMPLTALSYFKNELIFFFSAIIGIVIAELTVDAMLKEQEKKKEQEEKKTK